MDHYSLSDRKYIEEFETCKLDPEWFTHEAHLRLAYLYINKFGVKRAAVKLCEGISKFDSIFGSGDKFHRTITVASVGVLYHFMQKSSSADFRSLIKEFPVLIDDFRSLLLSHYSTRLINSSKSKEEYQLPDLLSNEVFEEVM